MLISNIDIFNIMLIFNFVFINKNEVFIWLSNILNSILICYLSDCDFYELKFLNFYRFFPVYLKR